MLILVVEDDQPLRETIAAILRKEQYSVDEAGTGDDGLFYAEQGIHDLLLLDIMLPGRSGLDIVRKIRESGSSVPILLLTAMDSVEDKVRGLEAGADDYLVKPFAVPELLARIKALLRRRGGGLAREDGVSFGEFVLYPRAKEAATREGAPLHLTPKEYELLEFLALNRGQILTRQQIYDRIWGFTSDTSIGIVDLYVHYLRKKLAPFGKEYLVRTVRGAGFVLAEQA